MMHAHTGNVEVVACLLQDPRVRATVNVRDRRGNTALHWACTCQKIAAAAPKVLLLLQAGADPFITTFSFTTNNKGQTPLAWAQENRPTHHAVIALLEHYPASLLIKARRLAVAANSNTAAPSCLQVRVARGAPLPHVTLMPLTDGQNDENEDEEEEGRKLRTTLAFICGVGREGMPRDVFRVVMDLLMPSWDPLRRKNAGTGPLAVQG